MYGSCLNALRCKRLDRKHTCPLCLREAERTVPFCGLMYCKYISCVPYDSHFPNWGKVYSVYIICPDHNRSKNIFQGRISMFSTNLGNGSLLIRISFFTSYSSAKAFRPFK